MIAATTLALLLASPSNSAPPSWEKVYEHPDKKQKLVAVWADDRGWFAAGPRLLLSGDASGVHPQPVGERAVVAFSGATRAELFAVGWDEVIFKLEGDKWLEEHRALGEPKGSSQKGTSGADLFETVASLPGKPKPVLAAIGPSLVLLRNPDAFWQAVPDVERPALMSLAHQGPRGALPADCTLAIWRWVGQERAVFSCRDGRSFVFDAGKVAPAGKLPRACDKLEHARLRGTEAFALCSGQLWRSDGKRWQRDVVGPAKLRDYAFTDRCLYAVTDRAVWRRCSP
jgi:hypothetical protein